MLVQIVGLSVVLVATLIILFVCISGKHKFENGSR